MPDIKADDGCTIHAEVEGPEQCAGADAVEFARHRSAYVGRAGRPVHPAFSPGPLRPARPWQVRACRRAPTRWSGSAATWSRVLDGLGIAKINWCGLSMGGMVGQWLGANAGDRDRQAHTVQHRLLLSRQDRVGRPHQAGTRKRPAKASSTPIWSAGSPGRFANAPRKLWQKCAKCSSRQNVEGYIGCGEAIRDMDHRPLLAKITRADFGHCRPARSGDAARRQRVHQSACSRRRDRRARCRAYRQSRAAAGLRRYGAGIFAG